MNEYVLIPVLEFRGLYTLGYMIVMKMVMISFHDNLKGVGVTSSDPPFSSHFRLVKLGYLAPHDLYLYVRSPCTELTSLRARQ